MLTKQQIELVKATVPVLREHGVALTSHFYKRMLSHNPELMQVFNMGHQRAGFQQQALAGAVLAYAENIENLPALLGAVAHIANKHVSVGIRAEHYPIVGKHLIASIKEVLGDAATPELIDAWTAAYIQLADVLIGAEKAIYDKNAVAEGGWTGWRFFKVAEKSKQTDNVTSFKLVPVDNGKMPEVKAGQYISVRVFVKGQDLIQPRQYTVVKADATSLTIAVKKVEAVEKSPAGMVSNTLHNDINEGDVVEVSFPVGEFNLPEGNGELCLLSAGIGITPLFAMLKEAVQKDPTRKISFVHVCKNKEAIPFREELALVVKEGNVSFEVFETSEHGRPSEDFFKSLVSQGADYCICGPVPFMKLAASELVKNGVAENKIHAEKFGTGAI
ncbi:flavohemoprotein [Proteobacteria bacterium CAG:139]|nr:flavohemoprotein [Proteobacteria bacterium CAG:139]